MREVSGTTWTFQLIILFIFLFACFLTLVLSYSRAYKVKNEFLTIVEKYEGTTAESLQIYNGFLKDTAYKATGKCPDDTWQGAIDLDGNTEEAQDSTKYYYCYKENNQNSQAYYEVEVFYNFNLPVIGELATFKIYGRSQSFPKE